MALQINGLPRKFTMDVGGAKLELDDINPDYTPERIKEIYSMTYPALTNAKIEGPELKRDHVAYTFSGVVGTKG